MKKILIALAMVTASANCLAETYSCFAVTTVAYKNRVVYSSGRVETSRSDFEYADNNYFASIDGSSASISSSDFNYINGINKNGRIKLDKYSVLSDSFFSQNGSISSGVPYSRLRIWNGKISLHIKTSGKYVNYPDGKKATTYHSIDYKSKGICSGG